MKKQAISFLLALLMVVQMVPLSGIHVHAAGTDVTDQTIDFHYKSAFAAADAALKADAKATWSRLDDVSKEYYHSDDNPYAWARVSDGDLKTTGGRMREILESSIEKEKYVVLTEDVELRIKKGEWEPIVIKSDKILDLNGKTLTWWDMTNKDSEDDWQSTEISDHYQNKHFIEIREGATLTIIDSSMYTNGKNTLKGTGKIVAGAYMIDAYKEQIDYYTHRDIFVVDGNLVIYGGTFQAGRQKDQYKSNFTWDKLKDTIGKTITLGVSIAEYATGLEGATAALDDIKLEIAKSKPKEGNSSDKGETASDDPNKNDSASAKKDGTNGKPTENSTVQTPASAGGDTSKDRAQTVGERTAEANKKEQTQKKTKDDSKPSTGSSAAQTGGENKSNEKGTAKVDENSKIAQAEKSVVNAALDQDKIMSMYDKTAAVIDSIAGMIGNAEGTRITHTIHGTVAKVTATGTLVVYDGTLMGHGSTPNVRNATIEIVRNGLHSNSSEKQKTTGGRAYIYGGTIEGYAGANCFNFVRANSQQQAMQINYTGYGYSEEGDYYFPFLNTSDGTNLQGYKMKPLCETETTGLEVLHYENQDAVQKSASVTPIPIDTSNVVVRGGTFRCHYELANVATRDSGMKASDPNGDEFTMKREVGTSGSVNLGLESFGEDMIRDGRIQLVDRYGDGSLVLMDEEVDAEHPAGLKHYRLYCGDSELRHIRYLEVFPMNAGSNSTHSFALQTYYGDTNLSNISTWNQENDEENLHTAPFAGDEYFFDYEFDARDAGDYYVMPNLDGGVYGEKSANSEAWYYNIPLDTSGKPIPDFAYGMTYAHYRNSNQDNKEYYAPIYDLTSLEFFDSDGILGETFYQENYSQWRYNLKWFRYRVYRVDPVTRENISESETWGVDEPLIEVVYGVAENDAMKCKLPLDLLAQAVKEKHPEWKGYQSGELYRIVFNVDEYLTYGYTGQDHKAATGTDIYAASAMGITAWGSKDNREHIAEAFVGNMPVASTESSVLFRCSSVSEQAKLPVSNASANVFYDTDYTPLQFDTFAVMAGQNATINFRNAKVSQADNAGSDFIDVYYQWYISDDAIVDRDPADPNKVTDDLLAGMTNICLDWSKKSDHKPEKWNPAADVYEYRNSLSPEDPNYAAYGEDGLHDNPEYWTMYDLHAYTTELRQNELCAKDPGKELSMQNNNPFAFNTDSCYIPKEAAGKYVYVKAIVTNLKEEYTKVYDQKQVFYSHPMLIIDPSMLNAQTQQPTMDFDFVGSENAYYAKTTKITLGEEVQVGFTGAALPENMRKEGFEVRLSQKIYDNYNKDQPLYQAEDGKTVNLKDYIQTPGQYTVEQTQTLYYLRPVWSYEANQYKEPIIQQTYVTSRIDRFPVTVDLPLPENVTLDYPSTGFKAGEEITLTANVEPAGEYWYKWLLDGDGALDTLTVLQDSQSNVLKYTFADETPQQFWVGVYAKDKDGNASVDTKYAITGLLVPGEQLAAVTKLDGKEITSENKTIYLQKGAQATMTVEAAGGKGAYTYKAYKVPNGAAVTFLGQTNTVSIDTGFLGQAEYYIDVYDAQGNQIRSEKLHVFVKEPVAITSARTEKTTINQPMTLNLWARYTGYQVKGKMYEKNGGSWTELKDVKWEENGDCRVSVSAVGTHEYRLELTDYFGNQVTRNFTIVYDQSVPQSVAADGKTDKGLQFKVKGESGYKTVFSEDDDIVGSLKENVGFILDPDDDLYKDVRKYFAEKGLDIMPIIGNVTVNFALYRYDNLEKAKVGGDGGEQIYAAAGLTEEMYKNQTFATADKLPETINLIDGTYMKPGYYYASVHVYNSNPDLVGTGGSSDFIIYGCFEVVASGKSHSHNYTYASGAIDGDTHYQECICGERKEGRHQFDKTENAAWTAESLVVDGAFRKSGVEYRVCQQCWSYQRRWAFVEDMSLEKDSLVLPIQSSAHMAYTVSFMEKLDDQCLQANPTYYSQTDIANFLPGNAAVIWTSSNESVAKVDENGNITAVGAGTATISATTVQKQYGGSQITKSCTVTVSCDHAAKTFVNEKASTCSVNGCVAHYLCSDCGAVTLDGTFKDNKTLEDTQLPLADHAPADSWSYDGNNHFRTCAYGCGYTFEDLQAHTYNGEGATCHAAKYCTVCQYVAEPVKSHKLEPVAAVGATCTDPGMEDCYKCSVCGGYFVDAEGKVETTKDKLTVKALGHNWKEATCETPKTCGRCGATSGSALGHSWVDATCEAPKTCGRCGTTSGSALGHTWVEATCTNAKTCSVCLTTSGDKLPHSHNPADATCTTDAICPVCKNVIIAATGHHFVDKTCENCGEILPDDHVHTYTSVVTPPTCTEKGFTTHTCTCADKYVDSYVDPVGHSWDAGVITKEPTESETGLKTYTCTACAETKTEEIPAGGHIHTYTGVVTAPTCTEKGYTTHTCACGDSYVDSYVEPTGHIGGTEIKGVVEATCTEDGYSGDTYCKTCGAKLAAGTVVAAKGHNYVNTEINPSYTKPGYAGVVCEYCHDVQNAEEIAPLGLPTPTVKGSNDPATGGALLTWEADGEADYYEIYRATKAKGKYTLVDTVTEAEAVLKISVGKSYYYKVKAVCETDAALSSGQSKYVKVTGKLARPTVTVTTNTSGKPVLKWNKVSGAKKYYVYRSLDGGKETKIGTATKTTYTDSKAAAGKNYTYRVRAYGSKSSYTGAYSDGVAILAKCTQPVITVKINAVTGKPAISWKTVSGAESYLIQRKLAGESEFQDIQTVSALKYEDATAPVDTDAEYKVVAQTPENAYDSAPSTVKKIHTTLAKPVVTFSVDDVTGKPTVTWEAVEGAVKYQVYRSTKSTSSYKAVKTTTDLEYTDTSASVGKGYYYKVIAIGANSKGAYSAYKKLTAKCAQPVITVEATDDGNPVIKWSKVSGAKKYEIYRSTEGGSETKLATTTKTSYTDKNTADGTTYTYCIRVLGSKTAYNSVRSESVSCTTHKHDYKSEVVKATCTAKGYTKYTCSCGDSYKANETDELDHDYKEEIVKATYETGGYTKYTCKVCGHYYEGSHTAPLYKPTEPTTPPATEKPSEDTKPTEKPTEPKPTEPEVKCSYCGGPHYLYECAKAKEDAATKPTEARKCNLCGSTTCPSLSNKGSKKDCPAYDEKKDPSKYCLYCGKSVDVCKRWLKDKKCPDCGEEVPARTCHYC